MKKLWLLFMLLPLAVYSSEKSDSDSDNEIIPNEKGSEDIHIDKDKSNPFLDEYRFIVMQDDVDTVRKFVEGGGNVNTEDGFLLHFALFDGSEKIARYLLARPDINVNAADPNTRATPLMEVVVNNSTIQSERQAEVQAKRLKLLQLLLKRPDLEINAQDQEGHTALYYAATAQSFPAVELLLRHGAKVVYTRSDDGKEDKSAAGIAYETIVDLSQEKIYPSIKKLLQYAKEFEPAVAAMPEFPQEIYDVLFEKMKEDTYSDDEIVGILKDEKSTVKDLERLNFFKHSHYFINRQDALGYTLLHKAVLYNRPDMVNLFLNGADTSLRTFGGQTAYDLAQTDAMRKVFEDYKKVKKYRTMLNEQFKKEKKLANIFTAADKGYASQVKKYINGNSAINVLDVITRLTPLMLAARAGNTIVVEMLLDAGADTSMVNNNHETALILAVRAGKVDIVRLLLERMRPEDVVMRNAQEKNAYDIAQEKLQDVVEKLGELGLKIDSKIDPTKSKQLRVLYGITGKKRPVSQEIVDMLAKYKDVKEREVKRKDKKA